MADPGRKLPSLVSIFIIAALAGGSARAQDLDAGKSGAELFAASCANCHRSPRGLVKDRFSWTLSYFLQQHYTSSRGSVQALAAYLQSFDAPRVKSLPAGRKPLPPATSAPEPSLRPPAPVPNR
jgi:mono/diheme cytochrome c family protein